MCGSENGILRLFWRLRVRGSFVVYGRCGGAKLSGSMLACPGKPFRERRPPGSSSSATRGEELPLCLAAPPAVRHPPSLLLSLLRRRCRSTSLCLDAIVVDSPAAVRLPPRYRYLSLLSRSTTTPLGCGCGCTSSLYLYLFLAFSPRVSFPFLNQRSTQ